MTPLTANSVRNSFQEYILVKKWIFAPVPIKIKIPAVFVLFKTTIIKEKIKSIAKHAKMN